MLYVKEGVKNGVALLLKSKESNFVLKVRGGLFKEGKPRTKSEWKKKGVKGLSKRNGMCGHAV